MELDFDRLNNLGSAKFQKNAPSKTPSETVLNTDEYKSSSEQENALKGQYEGVKALQRKAEQNKAEKSQNLEIYKTYQDNIRRSKLLQTDILKGTLAGKDIYTLFLKAIQAISCMTSNQTFYNIIEENIKSIYGRGLQEPAPLMLELAETEKRLERLKKAEEREQQTDSRNRIQRAIKAHETRAADLKQQIAKAQERSTA